MGRAPCCSKEGLNRGPWAAMEDKMLRDYIKVHGEGKWRNLPKRAGLKRCGKSCRLRWLNYLRPDIKRGNITRDEEELIIRLHNLLGNRWALIAGRLPGRTDNEIKNYWNTNVRKKLQSGHDLPSTSINKKSCGPAKPTSSNQTLRKLPPPSPKKTTPSKRNAPQLVHLPYSKSSSSTSTNSVHVIRTKAIRLTKVALHPDQDPQKPPPPPPPPPPDHDKCSKPAVDTVQPPPPSAVNKKVNDIYDNNQTMAGTGLDHDQHLVPSAGLPTDDESNNSSQLFMAHINQDHDFEITEGDEKFLSEFLKMDCLDLELANLFGNGEHDSCNNIMNEGFDDETLFLSDQDHMALFGLSATELQYGTISTTTTASLIDQPHDHDDDEMDWIQH